MKKTTLLFIIISLIFIIQNHTFTIKAEENFTFELGTVTSVHPLILKKSGFNILETSQIGYQKRKDNTFLHIFWGSLSGEHEHRTSYIFGEIGYMKRLDSNIFFQTSIGIGRVSDTSIYLSSNNMFTERISIGYENIFIALRHMSNGSAVLKNPDPNKGRNTLTIGYLF